MDLVEVSSLAQPRGRWYMIRDLCAQVQLRDSIRLNNPTSELCQRSISRGDDGSCCI